MLLTLWESLFAASASRESSVWVRPTGSQPCPKLATKSETRQQTSSTQPVLDLLCQLQTQQQLVEHAAGRRCPYVQSIFLFVYLKYTFFPPFCWIFPWALCDGRRKIPQPASTASCPFTTSPLTCLICEIKQLQSFKSLFIKCLQA